MKEKCFQYVLVSLAHSKFLVYSAAVLDKLSRMLNSCSEVFWETSKMKSVGLTLPSILATLRPQECSPILSLVRTCLSPKETGLPCADNSAHAKLTKFSMLWNWKVILHSVWEKLAYPSSDIVTASCLGTGILTLFLPLIEQQLHIDSFHLWVALLYKLFISLTSCLPPAYSPLCTALCFCWFLG